MHARLKHVFIFVLISLLLLGCDGEGDGLDGSLELVDGLEQSDVKIVGVVNSDGSVSNELGLQFDRAFRSDSNTRYEITPSVKQSKIVLDIAKPASDGVTQDVFIRISGFINRSRVSSEGTKYTIELNEGVNIIAVRNMDEETELTREYRFSIKRVSSNSNLASLVLNDLTGDTDVFSEVNRAFSPTISDYSIDVPFGQCTMALSFRAQSLFASIKVNGEVKEADLDDSLIDLSMGTNKLTIEVISEDEQSTDTYTVTINRLEPTEKERLENFSLSALTFDPAELVATPIVTGVITSDASIELLSPRPLSDFHCQLVKYNLRVNNNVDKLTLGALASIDGLTVQAGKLVTKDAVTNIENPMTISMDNPVSFDLVTGDDDRVNFGIVILDEDGKRRKNQDGDEFIHYTLEISRRATNVVRPETSEALQSALQSAMPGDEIILAEGVYNGASTEDRSGKEGVVFYSEASGTEDKRIFLRGFGGAVLTGSDAKKDAVLQLSGNYWTINDIAIENAAEGLVLDAANDNTFARLSFTDIGQRGIVIRNGSNRNAFFRSDLKNIGNDTDLSGDFGEAVVIGSEPEQWKIATPAGPFEHVNDDNVFFNATIGPDVAGELVDIKPGNTGTIIRYGTFDASGIAGLSAQNAAIFNRGNESVIEYSNFIYNDASPLKTVVLNSDVTFEWVTTPWGEDAKIYDNVFDLSGNVDVKAVAAQGNVDMVFVEDNRRDDGVDINYNNSKIVENSPPRLFQLKPADMDAMCIRRDRVPFVGSDESVVDIELIVEAACGNVEDEYWEIVHDRDSAVFIRALDKSGGDMVPIDEGGFRSVVDTIPRRSNRPFSRIYLLPQEDTRDNPLDKSASVLRWIINSQPNGDVFIVNKFDSRYGLTLLDLTSDYKTEPEDQRGLVIERQVNVAQQRFKLVPVVP